MTKAQRHKLEAARARREADRLLGMAYSARIAGKGSSAALLISVAEHRSKAAAAHELAFAEEMQLVQSKVA